MSASMRASSAPSSARPEQALDTRELNLKVAAESRNAQPPPVNSHFIPDELLVGLTSTVCNGNSLGHTVHHQHCEGRGLRRPDAVWHHPLGRRKYKYFLEQPTSLTGAGRRPSGRLEVVLLMRMMDDMLEKAGVDQQTEELTQLSQMEGLLELVQIEQNIYNIVFHELIRQVSVGCVERGQLLAKLRQRYQSLLERIPRRLKTLHTELVAQRALDRRLTEEINHIKTSIQQLSTELSKIRDHDASVSQQAKRAHCQLAEALEQTHTNSDVVQGYHELYELQRGRLESQLLQMTEERDCWSQRTVCLALKVISLRKLRLVKQLHVYGQSWFKTAEHCILYLTSKDTEDLKMIIGHSNYWKEELIAFMSRMKKAENAQFEEISAIQEGITKWLSFCTTHNKLDKCSDPNHEKTSLEKIYADLKQWSNMLTLQCERYQGEKLFNCQHTLQDLGFIQERWLDKSCQLFRRHSSPDSAPPESQLGIVLSELLKQLDTRVSGESGVHGRIMTLLGLMESWVSKLSAVVCQPEMMPVSEWVKLEKALCRWQNLAEETLRDVSSTQTENEMEKNKPDIYTGTKTVFDRVQEFITSLFNFTDSENHRLSEEVNSIHMGQTRWMLDVLLLIVPDHSEDQEQEPEHQYITNISPQTLDEDAKTLAEKLDYFSSYITSFCKLILEEDSGQNQLQPEDENEMNMYRQLQRECDDWKDICMVLLSKAKGRPVELSVMQPATTSRSDVAVSPADSMETLATERVSAEPTTDSGITEVKTETEAESRDSTDEGHDTEQPEICEGEPTVCETPVVKLISYDGNISQKRLGESSVYLDGTDELVVTPATDKAQRAFSDLTTVGLLQQELHDSELRVQSAEQRALKAEEALQAALEKIQDLERQLQGQPSLEPRNGEEKKTPPPSPPEVTAPHPPKKTAPETKPTTSTKKTRKR
ncbi:hypothetical protein INR49_025330 [Caranx melampygus]|nr:hypothetical protein INR49_025330 [Caranx melampygus]